MNKNKTRLEAVKITEEQLQCSRKQVDGFFSENDKLTKEIDDLQNEIKNMKDRFGLHDVCEHGGFLAITICNECKTG